MCQETLFQNGFHFNILYVCIQISPSCPVLKFKNEKNNFTLNEARGAYLNANKRILKWQPFWNKVNTTCNYRSISKTKYFHWSKL